MDHQDIVSGLVPIVIEQSRELGLPDGPLFGTVGRLHEVKNHPLLIRALAALRARGVPATLAIVGEGAERPMLEQLARELDVADHVRLLGWRTDVARVVGSFDVFVLSSWTEGLPMAVLEAMSAGLPVVSTRVGDVPRVLEEGHVGRLVPVDDVPAMVDALAALLTDEATRRTLGARARQATVRHHNLDAMVDAYLEAYAIEGASVADDMPAGIDAL